MAPVSATDSLVTGSEESVQFDMSKLCESAVEYISIATTYGDNMCKGRALILNKQGRALKRPNKGDFVKIMFPCLMKGLKLEKEKRSM